MTHKTVLLLLLISHFSFTQIKITDTPSKEALINVIVSDEPGINISNIKKTGNKKAFGIFNSNFKYNDFIKEGIIISTGFAKNVKGPNDNPQKSIKVNFISDQDILAIDNNKTSFDTAYLEFDLVSETDQIQFNFSFASEEYPEYVNKNVNDTFIFLLTNLTTRKTKNLALLNNDSSTPISVDNINHLDNSKYYIANQPYKKEKNS